MTTFRPWRTKLKEKQRVASKIVKHQLLNPVVAQTDTAFGETKPGQYEINGP